MVLQRDKPIKIWGNANPNTSIKVAVTWADEPFVTKVTSSGFWEVIIPQTSVNANPQNITISKSDEITSVIKLDNILIGDVWICAGQSNMAMPVGPSAPSFQGVENYPDEIANSNYPQIRVFKVKEDNQQAPLDNFKLPSNWMICSPNNVASLSATAYFFAKKLHIELNVPIGIVVSAVNGSRCENWINQEAFSNYFLSNYFGNNQSSTLFNGMIAPLNKLSINSTFIL